MNKVVVTGMGVISPIGNDLHTFWQGLIAGKCASTILKNLMLLN